MPPKHHPRDIAIANLKAHTSIDDGEIQKFKNYCIVLEYFSRPNHCGGVMLPCEDGPERRMLSNGKWIEWKDVPLKRVIDDAEGWIEIHIAEEKRTETWIRMHEGLPFTPRTSKWDLQPANPNQHPATPYSACRAKSCPSNAELINRLASATDQNIDYVGPNIAWKDSSDGNNWGFTSKNGTMTVLGGRLGRDHTLQDVPHHFVRDQLMDWMHQKLPAHERRGIEKAVFNDLSDEDLDAYWNCLEELSRKEEEAPQNRKSKPQQRRDLSSELEGAICDIDCDIDLFPHWFVVAQRDYKRVPFLLNSCVNPTGPTTEEEDNTVVGDNIHQDCDQVRAMIALLVLSGDWTIEEFRKALGITKQSLLSFLQRQGPWEGMKSNCFQLAWEFFEMRDILDVPLPGMSDVSETTSEVSMTASDILEANGVSSTSDMSRMTEIAEADLGPLMKRKPDGQGSVIRASQTTSSPAASPANPSTSKTDSTKTSKRKRAALSEKSVNVVGTKSGPANAGKAAVEPRTTRSNAAKRLKHA